MIHVLYEDNHVIAVEKPHGFPVQGDRNSDTSLLEAVKQFIKVRDAKPGNVFLGLIHRLDQPVHGIVLFAKTSKGASRLSAQFRARTVEKEYLALVEGMPKRASGVVKQWVWKERGKNLVHVVKPGHPGAKEAELTYRVLGPTTYRGQECSTVKILPKTGRPHQIRVAMQSLGTPIVGDKKYGATTRFKKGIALSATELRFDQAVTKERITVRVEPSWMHAINENNEENLF